MNPCSWDWSGRVIRWWRGFVDDCKEDKGEEDEHEGHEFEDDEDKEDEDEEDKNRQVSFRNLYKFNRLGELSFLSRPGHLYLDRHVIRELQDGVLLSFATAC